MSSPPGPGLVAVADAGDWTRALVTRCRFPHAATGPVTLAVSGGADSMALVVLAAAAGLRGRVVHVDHGLRDGSAGEAGVVGRAARAFGFDFGSIRVDVPPGPDLEARARRARYQALPRGVLTGHTMDDQAETVLLNVLRGAALDGMAAMRPAGAGAAVVRPLLGLRRSETVEVCRRAGLEPLVDPSNLDRRFRRNRVRLELLPLLCDVAQRDVVPILSRQAELVASDVELLEELAAGLDPTEVADLRAAPGPLARRALRRWLRSPAAGADGEAHPPSAAELGRVMEVVHGHRVACQISGGRRVARRSGRLSVAVPGCPGPSRLPQGSRS